MDILTSFGNRLSSLRVNNNLSQEKLAEMTGLHRTYISSLERGKRNPTLKTLEKLAIALNISIVELINDIGEN